MGTNMVNLYRPMRGLSTSTRMTVILAAPFALGFMAARLRGVNSQNRKNVARGHFFATFFQWAVFEREY